MRDLPSRRFDVCANPAFEMSDPRPKRPIVFVNRVYWPDEQATAQLLTDLAEGLAARGWPVTVVAGQSGRKPGPPEHEHGGVQIVRVGRSAGRSLGLLGKAAGYLRFSLAARRDLSRRLSSDHTLVVLTDPPFLASIAAPIARSRHSRLIHLIYDIHPEVELALWPNPVLRGLVAPWVRSRDRAWRAADCCVTLGGDMAALVIERGVAAEKTKVIGAWPPGGGTLQPVPPEHNPLRRSWGLEGHFVVAYSGNLGRVHALDRLAPAASQLRDLPDLVFAVIGGGPRRPQLEAAVARLGLNNVRFFPPQPRGDLAACLSVGDVHLVTLRSGCERCVHPSKLYGVLAVGRPIVFVGPTNCELARAVLRHAAGAVAAEDDPTAIATTLRTLHADRERRKAQGEAARAWLEEAGGLPAALDGWEKLLQSAPANRGNSRLP